MKTRVKLFYFIAILLATVACVNLDEVNERIDNHEKRLKSLEQLITSANDNIANLQKLLDAEKNKISIVSYTQIEGGYELVMSDGSKIILKNGNDAKEPIIGVKEENGVLYWTINGEFMLDADGNKIKAEGKDGAAGITPQIRVDRDGYWEISVDGGKTWQAVTDTNGNKVKAKGSDASVDLVIKEEDGQIVIIYNGQTFVVPKGESKPVEPVLEGKEFTEGSGRYYGNWYLALADDGKLQFTWKDPADPAHYETLEIPFNMHKLKDYNITDPKMEEGEYVVAPRPDPSYNMIPMTVIEGGTADFMGQVIITGTYLKEVKPGVDEVSHIVKSGKMKVSYNGDEATFIFDFVSSEGKEIKGYYKGNFKMTNYNDNDKSMPARPWSTLRSNKVLNFKENTACQIYPLRKSILPNINSWLLMIGSAETASDFIMVEFFSGMGDEKEPAPGIYTISKDLKNQTVLPGHQNYARDLVYSWYADMSVKNEFGSPTTVAPLNEGTMTIKKEGDKYTFTFDFKDDAKGTPHSITGMWSGTVQFVDL